MKLPFALTIILNALLVWPGFLVASSKSIVERETTLPLAYDVDVLVAGGSLPELKRPVLLQIKGHPYWSLNPVPTWASTSAPIRNYGLIQMKSPKLTSPDGSLKARSNKLP